jgi:acylphosphatase
MAAPDPAGEAPRALHLLIHGHVQGVGFRWALAQQATALGLVGWVRNRSDGRSVEALAWGPASALRRLADWARHGPATARVEQVEVREATAAEVAGLAASKRFEQRPTV